MKTKELVETFLKKETETINSLKREKNSLIKSITEISKRVNKKGRVIYVGAGTSGRLGVLDAVECKPTFSTDLFLGVIAGGKNAVFEAKEGAEDDVTLGIKDIKKIKLNKNDVVIGISASGETPYTVSAIKHAKKMGVLTVGIASNPKSTLVKISKCKIAPVIKKEIIQGSSRLSSGTAQKIILNMISSISMINAGKVYGDLMIDVQPTNKKLVKRAVNIIATICKISFEDALNLFKKSNKNTRAAIVMYYKKCDLAVAKKLLSKPNFNLKKIII